MPIKIIIITTINPVNISLYLFLYKGIFWCIVSVMHYYTYPMLSDSVCVLPCGPCGVKG